MERTKLFSRTDENGLTLPFALILTFIFSALVSVSFLFVSINLRQMYTAYRSNQAISVAEGINERIKARLNTKSKVQISPDQEKKLKLGEDDYEEEEGGDEDLLTDDEFDEEVEDFDEYYADEVLKISRYITFRDPAKKTKEEEENAAPENKEEKPPEDPLSNVEMIGSIDIPRGTVLNKGTKIVVFKDEKINLMLDEIFTGEEKFVKPKTPLPFVKSLTPNYCEVNTRCSTLLGGDNLIYGNTARFSNKGIVIEDIRSGPSVRFLVPEEVMPGICYLYWEGSRAEFYLIPHYEGDRTPVISDVRDFNNAQFISVPAGKRQVAIKITGSNLYNKKNPPVVIGDAPGLPPKVLGQSNDGDEITVSLNTSKQIEPGVHSITVATEGGLSNAWVFNILPPDDSGELNADTALVSSSLTLLNVRVIENLLPLIGEGEENAGTNPQKTKTNTSSSQPNEDPLDILESQKLNPFSNVDLETSWLIETTAMVGKSTKTVSEIVSRRIPNVHAALTTNGTVQFDGGNYRISSASNASTKLTEPVYILNTILPVEGPPENYNPTVQQQENTSGLTSTQPKEEFPKSPIDLGFIPNSFIALYMEGNMDEDLDYGVISQVGINSIEVFSPGVMAFHYSGDLVTQFIPPVISGEKIDIKDAEAHLIPKELALKISHQASFENVFKTDLDQLAELADFYTNDPAIPKDEFDIPAGYMGLSFIETTAIYDKDNPLTGKGILIIDTRSDNLGRPIGEINISGDSKSPSNFNGIVYVFGNLRVDGNLNIDGALIVDDESNGMIQFSSNSLGRINYDERAIKQALVYTPFTTKAGSVMISNKPINLEGLVQGGTSAQTSSGTTETPNTSVQPSQPLLPPTEQKPPEEALIEEGQKESLDEQSPEFDLIQLF